MIEQVREGGLGISPALADLVSISNPTRALCTEVIEIGVPLNVLGSSSMYLSITYMGCLERS